MNRSFEVVVVGAGPAGIAAATMAAEGGKSVALVDDNFAPGGQIWRGEQPLEQERKSNSPSRWFRRVQACTSITRFFGSRVFDAPAAGILMAESQGECIALGFRHLILATGARERFLPFPGWTLPNVMGAGALQAMVKTGLPIRGKRVVVAGSGPLLLAVAAYLRQHGGDVIAICEQATWTSLARFAAAIARSPAKLGQALHYGKKTFGIPFRAGCWPVAAHGEGALRSVTISDGAARRELDCDYLACGFHLVPNLELPMLLGCRVENGAIAVDGLQRTSVDSVYCVGEPTGIGGLEMSLLEGQIAGLACAGDLTGAQALTRRRSRMLRFGNLLATTFALRPELKTLPRSDTIVCRCEDVQYGLVSEHTSWRAAKLHTRCGMGPCQGRICGTALEFLAGWKVDGARPPISPVPMAVLTQSSEAFAQNNLETQETRCNGMA